MTITQTAPATQPVEDATKGISVGRIVSVTGSQAIALVFHNKGSEQDKALQPKWARF